MGRLRVSILGIMAIVVLSAVAFAALRNASDLWFSALYTVTTVLLLAAIVAAIVRRGGERAFWCGVAVFGWGFFLLGLGTEVEQYTDPEAGGGRNLNRNLLTSQAVLILTARLRQGTNDLEAIDKITSNTIGVAHLIVTLVIAVGGGAFAVWLRSRRGRQRRARSTTVALSIGAALALIAGTALSSDLGRTATPFFPKPVPRANDRLSPFEIRWASKHLYSMGEPSLTALASRDREATVCRLLWLPSFHHPVSVRIERNRRGAMLRVVVLDGAGGYEPGRIAIDRQLPLRDDQWLALQTRLDRVSFWTMPARINDGGVDGDRVTVECVNAGKYHVVNRYEPAPAFEEMCRFILDLTSLEYRKTWDEYHPGAAEPEVAEPAP